MNLYRIAPILLATIAGCSEPTDDATSAAGSLAGGEGGFGGAVEDRLRTIPVQIELPDNADHAVVYVNMSGFDSLVPQRGDQTSEEYEDWIRDELRIYTDDSGISWQRMNTVEVDLILTQFTPVFGRGLRTIDDESIGGFSPDACVEGCTLSVRATLGQPESTRVRADFWDDNPGAWMGAELEYIQTDRTSLSSLLEYDEVSQTGIVELGVVLLDLTGERAEASIGTRTVAIRTASNRQPAADTGLDAGSTVRESADGTRTEVPRE